MAVMKKGGAKLGQSLGSLWRDFKKSLKNEEMRFRWGIAVKLTAMSLITFLLLVAFIGTLLQLDLIFFEANGLGSYSFFAESFYDFLFDRFSDLFIFMMIFSFSIFIVGFYIANLLIRPFRLIGEYCEKKVEGGKNSYDPEFFADLKLLTNFSEFFFNQLELAEKKNKLEVVDIPHKYTRIHKPVFEKAFFAQYTFLIFVTSIFFSMALYGMGVDLHESIIELANELLSQSPIVTHFLQKQSEVLTFILWGVMISHFLLFMGFAFHLYQQVAGPAFGVFATMRAFIKGRYNMRVHLIGHYYLRDYCRKLNKYLDIVEKTLVKKSEDKK